MTAHCVQHPMTQTRHVAVLRRYLATQKSKQQELP